MIKYRIKSIPQIGSFAQVKRGFFHPWQTIGRHPNGFGLYPENHIDRPIDKPQKACDLANEWAVFYELNEKQLITYQEFDIGE